MDIVIYGVINSVSLALMALGFTLVYGVSRLPNFAHGALYVLTGYIAWLLVNRAHLSYPLAILLSLLCTGIIGAAMYQLILVRVRGMPISEIIASYAIGLAILEGSSLGRPQRGNVYPQAVRRGQRRYIRCISGLPTYHRGAGGSPPGGAAMAFRQ